MNRIEIDTSELITEIINTIDCYRYMETMTGEECIEQITEIIQKSDDVIYKPEYKRIVTDIQMLNKGIEDFNLKEIHSNVEGYVKETSYDQNSGFTIIVESDNKHHIYKGIYGLYLSPAEKIKIGDSLGMVKECLYYDVTEVE